MAEEKETRRKRRAPGGHEAVNGLANGSGKNGREAVRQAPKPPAKGRSVSPAANKKRRPYGMTDAVRDIVRTSPVLSILAAFAAGMIIGFRPRRR
ncbi:MAG: hypothetical protein AB7I96_05730 [Candidatus Dadabacteria bacterium]